MTINVTQFLEFNFTNIVHGPKCLRLTHWVSKVVAKVNYMNHTEEACVKGDSRSHM